MELRVRQCPVCLATLGFCRSCDRRYLYCSERCSRAAHRAQKRKFEQGVRQTFDGRSEAAKRQQRRRERVREQGQQKALSNPSRDVRFPPK